MNHNLFSTFAWDKPAERTRPLLTQPDGAAFSYADAWTLSARMANAFSAAGLQPGDRVTVQAAKTPQTLCLYLACLRSGLVYHPLNDAYQPAELEYFIGDAEPRAVICDPDNLDVFTGITAATDCRRWTLDVHGRGSLLEAAADCPDEAPVTHCDADTTAVLLYSSGTTGQPKGAMLTHANLASNTATLVEAWGFTRDDRLLHALPVYHAHGLFVGLGCAMTSGCSMQWLPKFTVDTVLDCLSDATVMMGVPTFYSRLLEHDAFDAARCTSIRLFISGSAPLTAELHERFRIRTGHLILERYGMTETSMLSSNPLDGERRPGSVGPALPGVTIRITDDRDQPAATGEVGNIQVKGPNVFKGYWRRERQTAQEFTADGFFRTGDQGRLDADHYLTIMGRSKDLIISGGLNVYPREVEQAIDALDGVDESAVIGVPHADFGEAVVAVIVAQDDKPPQEQELLALLRGRLANFKTPKRIFFVAELPRNTMGKVQKNLLRQQYQQAMT